MMRSLMRASYACTTMMTRLASRDFTAPPLLRCQETIQVAVFKRMCNGRASKSCTHSQAQRSSILNPSATRTQGSPSIMPPASLPEASTSTAETHLIHDPTVDAPPQRFQRLKSHFCRMCGSPMTTRKPEGEKEWRHVCSNPTCGYIDYFNPRMVVGCIVEHEGRILLARRAIEPCLGKWTVPAGYMELHESTAEGAARETREEVNAEVSILAPYCHWDIPVIGQAYILFRAQLAYPFTFSPGPESLEVALFDPKDIPYDSIAFSSVALSLKYYLEDRASGQWHMHHGVIDKAPSSGPNDPGTFFVRDHMTMTCTPDS